MKKTCKKTLFLIILSATLSYPLFANKDQDTIKTLSAANELQAKEIKNLNAVNEALAQGNEALYTSNEKCKIEYEKLKQKNITLKKETKELEEQLAKNKEENKEKNKKLEDQIKSKEELIHQNDRLRETLEKNIKVKETQISAMSQESKDMKKSLEDEEKKNKKLAQEIALLQGQVSKGQQHEDQLKQKLSALTENQKGLEEKAKEYVEKLAKQEQAMKAADVQTQKEISELRKELDQQTNSQGAKENNYLTEIASLTDRLKTSQKDATTFSDLIKNLEREFVDLDTRETLSEQESHRKENIQNRLTFKIKGQKQRIVSLEKEIDWLKRTASESKTQNQEMINRKSFLQNEVKTLKEEMAQEKTNSAKDKEQLGKEISSKERLIQEKTAIIESLQTDIETKKTQISAMSSQSQAMDNLLKGEQQKIEKLENQVLKGNQSEAELKKVLSDLENNNKDLKAAVEKHVGALKAQEEAMQKINKEAAQKIIHLQTALQESQTALADQKNLNTKDKEEAQKALDAVQTLLKASKENNNQLAHTIETLTQEIESLKKDKADLTQKLTTAEGTIVSLKSEMQNQIGRIKDLEEKNTQAQEIIKTQEDNTTAIIAKKEALEKEVASLRTAHKSDKVSTALIIEEKEKLIKSLEENINTKETQISEMSKQSQEMGEILRKEQEKTRKLEAQVSQGQKSEAQLQKTFSALQKDKEAIEAAVQEHVQAFKVLQQKMANADQQTAQKIAELQTDLAAQKNLNTNDQTKAQKELNAVQALLETSRKDNNQLSQQIQGKTQENTELTKKVDTFTLENQRLTRENFTINQILQSNAEEKAGLEEKGKILDEENKNLNEAYKKLKSDHEQIKEQLANNDQNNKNKYISLEKTYNALKEEIIKTKKDLDEKIKEYNKMTTERAEHSTTIKKINKEKEQLEQNANHTEEDKKNLTKKIDELEQKAAQIHQKYLDNQEEHQKKYQELDAKYALQIKEIQTLNLKITALETNNKKLTEELKNALNDKEKLQINIEMVRNTVSSLEHEKSQLNQEIATLKSQEKTNTAEINKKSEEIKQLTAEIATLREVGAKLKEAEDNNKKYEEELKKAAEVSKQYEDLKNQHNQTNAEKSKIEEKLKSLQATIEESTQNYKNSQEEANAAISELNKIISDLKSTINEYKEEKSKKLQKNQLSSGIVRSITVETHDYKGQLITEMEKCSQKITSAGHSLKGEIKTPLFEKLWNIYVRITHNHKIEKSLYEQYISLSNAAIKEAFLNFWTQKIQNSLLTVSKDTFKKEVLKLNHIDLKGTPENTYVAFYNVNSLLNKQFEEKDTAENPLKKEIASLNNPSLEEKLRHNIQGLQNDMLYKVNLKKSVTDTLIDELTEKYNLNEEGKKLIRQKIIPLPLARSFTEQISSLFQAYRTTVTHINTLLEEKNKASNHNPSHENPQQIQEASISNLVEEPLSNKFAPKITSIIKEIVDHNLQGSLIQEIQTVPFKGRTDEYRKEILQKISHFLYTLLEKEMAKCKLDAAVKESNLKYMKHQLNAPQEEGETDQAYVEYLYEEYKRLKNAIDNNIDIDFYLKVQDSFKNGFSENIEKELMLKIKEKGPLYKSMYEEALKELFIQLFGGNKEEEDAFLHHVNQNRINLENFYPTLDDIYVHVKETTEKIKRSTNQNVAFSQKLVQKQPRYYGWGQTSGWIQPRGGFPFPQRGSKRPTPTNRTSSNEKMEMDNNYYPRNSSHSNSPYYEKMEREIEPGHSNRKTFGGNRGTLGNRPKTFGHSSDDLSIYGLDDDQQQRVAQRESDRYAKGRFSTGHYNNGNTRTRGNRHQNTFGDPSHDPNIRGLDDDQQQQVAQSESDRYAKGRFSKGWYNN